MAVLPRLCYSLQQRGRGYTVNVKVRFLAVNGKLPNAYTDLTIPDRSTVTDLLNTVEQVWGDQFASTPEEQRSVLQNIMVASGGCMLRADEHLYEGQEINLIGFILGG